LSTPLPERNPAPASARAADPASVQLALQIAQRLDEKSAENITILDVSGPLVIAEVFVVATVHSTRQAQAIAREIDQEIKDLRGRRRRNTGGMETEESNWVLLDFDDVVVHLFLPEARGYYGLEELWADVPRVPFIPAPKAERAPVERRRETTGIDLGDLQLGALGAILPGDDADPAPAADDEANDGDE
jgi:ribosome-associated protein